MGYLVSKCSSPHNSIDSEAPDVGLWALGFGCLLTEQVANWFINARVRIWRPEVHKNGMGEEPRAVLLCYRLVPDSSWAVVCHARANTNALEYAAASCV